ncbi:hypothetical protein [Deinococcus radiotolerans]|uniref:Uncharacterized protein n=1 Tax=Deinococcus radiotolerans TaxID=1309407 RepID=A0ABQ2FQQ9_9DEIO|nr:hypothetical protein [Deinococcus radiotolerans]GGL17245.1 hypothetical protein GCM10010844_40140 [Deinococcus radiotolerans]
MNRSARIGGLLALILLICGAVIVLDQTRTQTGAASTPATGTPATGTSTPTPPSSNDGYGDLK